jgi:hypothetical protein
MGDGRLQPFTDRIPIAVREADIEHDGGRRPGPGDDCRDGVRGRCDAPDEKPRILEDPCPEKARRLVIFDHQDQRQ